MRRSHMWSPPFFFRCSVAMVNGDLWRENDDLTGENDDLTGENCDLRAEKCDLTGEKFYHSNVTMV